jgi:hypothetical protein
MGNAVKHGDDNDLFVRFYKNPVDGKDYVRINFPGDKTTEFNQPAREQDKVRFARQWEAYQHDESQIPEGHTRIEECGWINESRRSALKGLHVHTLEGLAAVSDAALPSLGMGARELRDKAMRIIADKTSNETLAGENKALKAQMEAMQQQIAELAQKRGPGRPKNVKDDAA